ncbi:hypothetical protein NDU88_008957 [Pleurodeles waltl]|uniref:Uncharacterized protein n=1 Tax=Pleurodeles waltl TaxID=8319 RepID=A0AAV7PR27_PLEWA|nr:hypothetical protein NDU88_008957 [Pleurodeles waltl]
MWYLWLAFPGSERVGWRCSNFTEDSPAPEYPPKLNKEAPSFTYTHTHKPRLETNQTQMATTVSPGSQKKRQILTMKRSLKVVICSTDERCTATRKCILKFYKMHRAAWKPMAPDGAAALGFACLPLTHCNIVCAVKSWPSRERRVFAKERC